MSEYGRELSKAEKGTIRRAVETGCANYDREYGCLLLEGACYMNTIGYTGSGLCRYFKNMILPGSSGLQAIFQRGTTKRCRWCGRAFPAYRHRMYCSALCLDAAKRRTARERVRRYRHKM